jgi:hypothetical protein
LPAMVKMRPRLTRRCRRGSAMASAQLSSMRSHMSHARPSRSLLTQLSRRRQAGKLLRSQESMLETWALLLHHLPLRSVGCGFLLHPLPHLRGQLWCRHKEAMHYAHPVLGWHPGSFLHLHARCMEAILHRQGSVPSTATSVVNQGTSPSFVLRSSSPHCPALHRLLRWYVRLCQLQPRPVPPTTTTCRLQGRHVSTTCQSSRPSRLLTSCLVPYL